LGFRPDPTGKYDSVYQDLSVSGNLLVDGMPWVVEDVSSPSGERVAAGGIGDLRDPNFPRAVGPDESWRGTIDVVNTGDETHTFRVLKDGTVKVTFDLPSEGIRTVTFEGTGPETFTIRLERKVKKGFLEKYRKEITIGSAITGGALLAYMAGR